MFHTAEDGHREPLRCPEGCPLSPPLPTCPSLGTSLHLCMETGPHCNMQHCDFSLPRARIAAMFNSFNSCLLFPSPFPRQQAPAVVPLEFLGSVLLTAQWKLGALSSFLTYHVSGSLAPCSLPLFIPIPVS